MWNFCRVSSLTTVFIAIAMISNLVFAEESIIPSPVNNSLNTLAQQRVVRISLPDEQTLIENKAGKFSYLVKFLREFWQIWAIDFNYRVEFLSMPNQEAALALKEGRIDINSITLLNAGSSKHLLSIPYALYNQRIYRRLKGDETNGIQIGIHSPTTETLAFLGYHIERSYYQNLDNLLDDYASYDALYSVKPWEMEFKLSERLLRQQFYISSDEAPKIYFHAATRISDRKLMYNINEGLRQTSNTQANIWTNKYFPASESNITLTLGEYFTDLSESEKQYLIDHNHLSYAITDEGLPPYIITKSFTNISERGFSVDLVNLVTKKTGILFRPYYVKSINEGVDLLKKGTIDLALFVEKTKNRINHFEFTIPYLSSHYSLITRDDSALTNNLSEFTNETFAALENHSSTEIIKERFPNAEIKIFGSLQTALKAVSNGHANALITHSLIASYTIKELQLSNLVSQPAPDFNERGKLSFATSKNKGSPNVISLLNRSINSISADQFDHMYSKWSAAALPEKDVKEHVDNAYRQASYVLGAIILLSFLVTWIYFRQLKVRKNAQRHVEHALSIAEAARAEAEKSAQAKIIFLAHMSHEIRTPMNGVLGMAEALTYTELDDKQSELLKTLQGSAVNLLALLNDVLDFSKMDAGKLTLESMPVDFSKLSTNIINSFSHHANRENVQLKLRIDDRINQSYFTDPTRLTQVLNNLISNSLKFTEQGLIELSITLIEQQSADNANYDTLQIAVKDTGIGIAKDKQALLFTPFIQADNKVTRKFGGTGLGLSICQEIVNAMGGKITLESEEGVGSKFHFTLTFKRADFEVKSDDRRKKERSNNAIDDNRFSGIRVLVAEDNIVNVTVITAQLARLNIIADVAEDGEQALNMHRENPYDIIISDCHMPVIDGFELAQKITSSPSNRAIWLIAVTADALSGSAEKCLASGFDDYLAKPCPQDEIDNKMHHAYRQLMRRRASIAMTNNVMKSFKLFMPQLLLKENDHDIVLAKSFASIFAQSWQQDKQQLLKALIALDYANIHAITHKCKGGMRYLCSNQLNEDAQSVEKYAQAQNKAATKAATSHFVEQLDLLVSEIRRWLVTLDNE
ncbi:ATP-binding protein [Thalassotalea atypica]|uniref:ATP-binding protein n=1 Tax=Thalassotalea atypica TaxID=2054316 RepID=UPI002572D3BF|nr:transporter substrate-binding domain-containing protein [Thalassotalea atypica]